MLTSVFVESGSASGSEVQPGPICVTFVVKVTTLFLACLALSPCRCCSLRVWPRSPVLFRKSHQACADRCCWWLWEQARPGGALGSPCLLSKCFLHPRLLPPVPVVWAPLNFTLTLAWELLADVEGPWGFPAMPLT